MPKQNPIKAGEIFYFTAGDYSDYYIHGVFRALRDIKDPDDLLITAATKFRSTYRFTSEKFIAFLIREGVVEQVDAVEWWLP